MDPQLPNETLAGQPVSLLEKLEAPARSMLIHLHLAYLGEARIKHAGDAGVLLGLASIEASCVEALRATRTTEAPRTRILSGPPTQGDGSK